MRFGLDRQNAGIGAWQLDRHHGACIPIVAEPCPGKIRIRQHGRRDLFRIPITIKYSDKIELTGGVIHKIVFPFPLRIIKILLRAGGEIGDGIKLLAENIAMGAIDMPAFGRQNAVVISFRFKDLVAVNNLPVVNEVHNHIGKTGQQAADSFAVDIIRDGSYFLVAVIFNLPEHVILKMFFAERVHLYGIIGIGLGIAATVLLSLP